MRVCVRPSVRPSLECVVCVYVRRAFCENAFLKNVNNTDMIGLKQPG